MRGVMKTTLTSACLVLLLAEVAAHADTFAAAPERARYIVVMKAAKAGTPDVSDDEVGKLGGKVEFRIPRRLVVTLPGPAVEALRKHERVKYVQRSVTGPAIDDGSAKPTSIMRLRPESSRFMPAPAAATPPVWRSGTYKYDGAGNIYAIGADPADADRRLYTYDLVSRLTREATLDGNGNTLATVESFGYDRYGNMTSHVTGATTVNYPTDTATNHLSTGTGLPPYLYNEIGALIRDARAEYDYDAFGMVRSRAVDGEPASQYDYYIYTPSDERIGVRQGGATWTWSFRDFEGKVLRQYQSSNMLIGMDWLWLEDYVYRGGMLVTGERVREEGGRREFHLDHLGSPRLVTGSDGYAVSTREFAPFGIQRGSQWQETDGGFDREDPMRFTGHERDYRNDYTLTTTEYLDYVHARYYDPDTGRFLSADPTWQSADLIQPQSWNRYAYVLNNPINLTDPDGRCPTCRAEDLAKMAAIQRMADAGDSLSQAILADGIEATDGPAALITGPSKAAGTSILAMATMFIKGGIRNAVREGGESVAKHTITSAIKNDNLLVKAAQAAGKRHQQSLDNLVGQLAKGNLKPGIGTRNVFGNVMEARAKDGARVYFRTGRDGSVEILAKSTKANQEQVINRLREMYGRKK